MLQLLAVLPSLSLKLLVPITRFLKWTLLPSCKLDLNGKQLAEYLTTYIYINYLDIFRDRS